MATRTLPDTLPEWKVCPDCYAEGREPSMLPVATHFYIKRSPRYPGGYRVGTYCKEHDTARTRAGQLRKQAGLEAAAAAGDAGAIQKLEERRLRNNEQSRRAKAALSPEEKDRRREKARLAAKLVPKEVSRARNERYRRTHMAEAAARSYRWYLKNRETINWMRRQGRKPAKAWKPALTKRKYGYRYREDIVPPDEES